MFLLYSGSSLHGGVCREGHQQQDGILLPTFFSTYLMAEKVKEKGKEEVEEKERRGKDEEVVEDNGEAVGEGVEQHEEEGSAVEIAEKLQKDDGNDGKGTDNLGFDEDESKL